MPVEDGAERFGDVGDGIDVVELAGGDNGSKMVPVGRRTMSGRWLWPRTTILSSIGPNRRTIFSIEARTSTPAAISSRTYRSS
jgi:hypothetical protein